MTHCNTCEWGQKCAYILSLPPPGFIPWRTFINIFLQNRKNKKRGHRTRIKLLLAKAWRMANYGRYFQRYWTDVFREAPLHFLVTFLSFYKYCYVAPDVISMRGNPTGCAVTHKHRWHGPRSSIRFIWNRVLPFSALLSTRHKKKNDRWNA